MHYIKENFNISDTTFKKIKKDVFSELNISAYYLESSKQGLFYTDNVVLANQIKEFYKGYQNTSKINDIIKDSINTPTNDLSLDIELKNDSLENTFKSKEVQKDNIEVFAPAGESVTKVTIQEQKENTTMSYDDYVNTNLSYLYDYLDKFITDKSLSGTLINDNDLSDLEDKLNSSTDINDSFKYEFLISDIVENLLAYNQQIKELIDFNRTNERVTSLKEKYDNYVNSNKSYLDKKVNDLIHRIANQDKLIDNKLIDDLLYRAKLHLNNNDIEKSLYHQFLVFNLSENIDKYNEMINKIQVDNDNKGIDLNINKSITDDSKYLDKEPSDNLDNHSSIFSLVFNDYNKDNELKLINDSILKISNFDVQKNLRKYISMIIINKIKLTNDYFTKLDKWVLKACDVDELINRQQLRDFVRLCKNRLEILIA